MTTKQYNTEDFANAELARHPDGRIRARNGPKYGPWQTKAGYATDADMVVEGWVPVREAQPITLDAHHTYERLDESVNQWGYRMIREGARWQREALLSDEAVERAARAEFRMNASLAADQIGLDEPVTWESLTDQDRDNCRAGARAALTAAIEGEK